ncbi:hypothetical protein [Streptomyces sp. NPDC058657]|uniref:hypothetical protein n=1 Tax=unclassified Streptomyces TaxID=2593676 RepID=UPI00364FFFA6
MTLTAARDGDDSQVNIGIRNAEFVFFTGGDQCRYPAWKGTAGRATLYGGAPTSSSATTSPKRSRRASL